ncbi:hypothetical protein J437_LFUL002261 [Ladona fulva]|uniref:Cytoplasmic dynein 2 heavy chain 1 n=1 Tax=Ladona fulva TaxID=123851 RepID=A0A8K0JY38_LADFU|nr:hypothetical protein J437_LFUL002261 [Ladona fulva]
MVSIPQMLCERDTEDFNDFGQSRKFAWNIFNDIHSSVATQLNSPCKFLSLIQTFKHIYVSKKTSISSRIERLQAGVSKLTEARSVVEGLKKNAADQKSILSEKQEKANEALQAIAETMRGANVKKSEMEALREKTIKENKALVERKAEIDQELSEVEPLVKEAAKAVGEIKSEALSEIRSLRAPPEVVRDILEGVLRLMGIQDTSWNSMKIFLSKRGVKEEIRAFDAHLVQPGNREAVEILLREHSESFNPKVAKRASVAAAPLATWVKANVKYSKVLQKIHPLEKEQETLVKNLKFAEHQLSKLAMGLADVEGNVEKLQKQLSTFSREAAETEVRLSEAQETLKASEGLVSQLQEEYNRWRVQVRELLKELEDLPWKVVLAAAFATYLLPSSEDLRRHYLQKWEEMVFEKYQSSVPFHFCHFLSTERELLQWQADGLPADMLSIENAVAILKMPICPLIIDPSMVCRDWLIRHLQDRNTEVVSQEMSKFDTTLELAVRFGKVLVVEDVECIHPFIIPVLRGDYIHQGTRKLVPVGEKLVDFHENFKIFLITQNENLELLSSVMSAVTYVNFTITELGLAGQLLSSVLQYVKPELDEQRIKLLKDEEQLNLKLEGIQENLLQLLATAQGDILQNKELLHSLNETKASSAAVTKSLLGLSNVRSELHKECDSYSPLTTFGSALYFSTLALGRIKGIYQYSTSSFVRLVNKALEKSENEGKSIDLKEVQRKLLRLVYYHVSQSLFKEDRMIFSLHLAHKMFKEKFHNMEWELFTGQVVVDVKSEIGKAMLSLPSWVEEDRVFSICQLKAVLPSVYAKLNLTKNSPRPDLLISYDEIIEGGQDDMKLTPFQKVLIAQAFVPDILVDVVSQFSQYTLGNILSSLKF